MIFFINSPSTNTSVNNEGSSVADNEDEAAKAVRSIQTILGHNDLESEQEKLALRALSHHGGQRNNSFEEVEANKENSEVAEQLKQLRPTGKLFFRKNNPIPNVTFQRKNSKILSKNCRIRIFLTACTFSNFSKENFITSFISHSIK